MIELIIVGYVMVSAIAILWLTLMHHSNNKEIKLLEQIIAEDFEVPDTLNDMHLSLLRARAIKHPPATEEYRIPDPENVRLGPKPEDYISGLELDVSANRARFDRHKERAMHTPIMRTEEMYDKLHGGVGPVVERLKTPNDIIKAQLERVEAMAKREAMFERSKEREKIKSQHYTGQAAVVDELYEPGKRLGNGG